ncbi:MAG: hypothetical protein VB092_09020, partial [Oscillospiraceae bacterium]|nr:hypothetical protein [Oscillospiraceae bacterium]
PRFKSGWRLQKASLSAGLFSCRRVTLFSLGQQLLLPAEPRAAAPFLFCRCSDRREHEIDQLKYIGT